MNNKLIQMEALLAVEFILGMITNLFGVPPDELAEHTEPLFAKVAFGAHSLFGLIILIGAGFTFVASMKQDSGKWKWFGILGLIGVLLAFGGGIGTATLKGGTSEVASLMMSFGFLFAFIAYGWYLLKLNQK